MSKIFFTAVITPSCRREEGQDAGGEEGNPCESCGCRAREAGANDPEPSFRLYILLATTLAKRSNRPIFWGVDVNDLFETLE